MKRSILILIVFLVSTVVHAKKRVRVPAEKIVETKLWQAGTSTVVTVKGNPDGTAVSCDKFSVKQGKTIHFDLLCGASEETKKYDSKAGSGYTVSRKSGYTTITKYGYMARTPKVSQLEQTQLRVPFVEEILHLREDKSGQLAFYYEKFRVDEFGRVVQDQLIQAYGLEAKKLEISSN